MKKKSIFFLTIIIINISCIWTNSAEANNIANENEVENTNIVDIQTMDNDEREEENTVDTFQNNNIKNSINIEKYQEDGMRTIKDGVYTIATRLDKTKVLSIENESKKSGANVRLWGNINLDFEKFKVTYLKDGYYSITCANSNQSLDVYQAGMNSGTNIAQSDFKGGRTQQWYIKEGKDGYYNIISRWNNLSIDVYHASKDNGTNIQLSNFTGGIAQQFLFNEAIDNQKTLEEGNYAIASGINTNKALDVDGASLQHGKNVQLWDREEVLQQQVNVKYLNNGFYSIRFLHSNQSLDAERAGWYHGTNISQSTHNGSAAQQWIIKDAGNGYYNIICRCNGLYMDVYHASMANGTNISLCDYNGSYAQKFKFIPVTEVLSKSIESGSYQIKTNIDSNFVLQVSNDSKENNANIQIWNNLKKANQMFKIHYLNNGYYTIKCVYSGKVLEIKDGNINNGTSIVQKDYDGSSRQQWMIRATADGKYNIISRLSKKNMDIHWAQTYNGNNVEVTEANKSNAQKFLFEKVDPIEVTTGTYGESGLKVKGDSRGTRLKYYKIGKGSNVYFGTFAVHGFEDLWNNDGQELTKIAEKFSDRLLSTQDYDLLNKWTIYIFPSVNPDGEYYGWTNNGPGRTTLYSEAPYNKGIDVNRGWSTGYQKSNNDRNYNGEQPFQAYEARALRDFLLNNRAQNGQTVLVDLHGWLNETIGDDGIGWYYRSKYGISKHIGTYGKGYLVNWARSNLGCNGRVARSCLVELPEYDVDANKYIDATIDMLNGLGG